MGKTHLFLTVALSLALGACSDGPEQYNRGQGPNLPTGDSSLNPDIGTFSISEDYPDDRDYRIGRIIIPRVSKGDDVDDALVKRNSSKPIVYKQGFAGITFDTTFDDARNIFSEPLGNNSSGAYLYREGMIVIWRQQDPKVPVFVIINADYLGSMELGTNLGAVKVGSDITSHFADDDGTGFPTLKKYFNSLEKKAADYDCIASNECQLVQNSDFYLFVLPSGMFKISKDRKVIAEIRLTKDISPGNMDNNFDLLNQNVAFQVPSADGSSVENKSIELSDNWDIAQEKIAGEGIASVGTDWFTVEYDGALLILTKDKFDRDYLKPENTEQIEGFYYTGSFTKNFTFDSKLLKYSYDLNAKVFNFSEIDQAKDPEYFEAVSENGATAYKKLKVEYVDAADKKLEFMKVKLPIQYEDGSTFFAMPEFTASADEIEALKNANGQIPEDQLAAAVIGQKQKMAFDAAVKELIVLDESSQVLGMKTTYLDDVQKHKVKDLNLTPDMEQMKVDFFIGLNNYLKAKLEAKHSDKSIMTRYQGLHAKEVETSYESTTLVYDKATGEGSFYQLSMAKLTGHLSKIYTSLANSEFNKKIFPELGKDLLFKANAKATELNGFKLGERIKITEIDNDREEATISSLDGSMKQRSGFDDTALRSVIYGEDGQIKKEILQSTAVGDASVGLYITKAAEADQYKVAQINTGMISGKINGLCGINDLDLKISTPSKEVVAKINQKISEKRQLDPNFKCVKFEEKYSDASGEVSSISFPKQGVKLYFSDSQFSRIGIYTSEKEALQSEVE